MEIPFVLSLLYHVAGYLSLMIIGRLTDDVDVVKEV